MFTSKLDVWDDNLLTDAAEGRRVFKQVLVDVLLSYFGQKVQAI